MIFVIENYIHHNKTLNTLKTWNQRFQMCLKLVEVVAVNLKLIVKYKTRVPFDLVIRIL